jgi:hypothetical protein
VGKLELEVPDGREGTPVLVHQEARPGAQEAPQRLETGSHGRELPGMGENVVGKRHVV